MHNMKHFWEFETNLIVNMKETAAAFYGRLIFMAGC